MVAPLMNSQVVMDISRFRSIDWEYFWEKNLNIHWEAPLKECQDQMRR